MRILRYGGTPGAFTGVTEWSGIRMMHCSRRVIPLLQGIEHLSALIFDRNCHCLSENVYGGVPACGAV